MSTAYVIREFDRLAEEAEAAMARPNSRGCPDIEAHGLAIVTMASQFPSLRNVL